MPDHALVCEKLDQAVEILNELGIDAWMTFVRETSLAPDPALDLILGMEMVWQSAFIVTRDNRRLAIVGKHDAENVRQTGGYTSVIPYVEGMRDSLVSVLLDLNPRQIALNYSEDDVAADGLGHGLMLMLRRYLDDTDLPDRFISAEKIVGLLRGRKSPTEIARIRAAIETTQQIFHAVSQMAQPGMSEAELADHVHKIVEEQHLGTAWDWAYCPTLNAGPDSPVGHVAPLPDYTVRPGTLLHMDFGVRQNSYCADLQRVWYVRRHPGDTPPPELARAFEAARMALQAGFEALRPGMMGWEVDQAARESLVAAGYPEYQHAFGHHVGRVAHDGATVLGPRWERYGQTPYGLVEAGNVFAIELGIEAAGFGYVGLEENILVTDTGAVWLSDPQNELWCI